MNREPRDELRMTDAELDESVAAFCDEAEDARFEAQAALLDSPDIVSGARPLDTCDECASVNVGPCPHVTSEDVIRFALGLGRANAIAQAIADEPPAHTLADAVAVAKEPFDAALTELALLREAVELAGKTTP